jgi:hypothetical protein
VGVPDLHLVEIKIFLIPILPINEQNDFSLYVKKVESLKSKYTQSLTELGNLYGSLSQRALKGELDLSRRKQSTVKDGHINIRRKLQWELIIEYKDGLVLFKIE